MGWCIYETGAYYVSSFWSHEYIYAANMQLYESCGMKNFMKDDAIIFFDVISRFCCKLTNSLQNEQEIVKRQHKPTTKNSGVGVMLTLF